MILPSYVPALIAVKVTEYQDPLSPDYAETSKAYMAGLSIGEIWTRLAVRPEMEPVWEFIAGIEGDGSSGPSLISNGGLLGRLNRKVRDYFHNPILSPTDYGKEFQEIAKMADALSRKLKKFTSANNGYNNPIPIHSLLTTEQLKIAEGMMREEILQYARSRKTFAGLVLPYYLPPIDVLLSGLGTRARTESKEQFHRIRAPRKINDKNTFRTYFIRSVIDYFFDYYADYSPTRAAIFCSVALDDADITPDLVRKLIPLNTEQKYLLAVNAGRAPED